MKKFLSSIFFLAVLFSCKTSKETTEAKPVTVKTEAAATPQTNDSLLAYLERTACYGTCPIYKFHIYTSGYAVYEGKRFVEKMGLYETQFPDSILINIKKNAKAINYFGFKDDYPKTASDFPSVKTAVVLDGKRKTITNGSGAPSALKGFEKYLDSLKDSADWKPVQ